MKTFNIKGIIRSKTQLNNSTAGGPRLILLIKEEGSDGVIGAKTATNSSAGYQLTCSMEYLKDRVMTFKAHKTRKNRIIIDQIISGYYD